MVLCLLLQAQRRNYVHYTTENGLPTNILYNTAQDSNGAIMINTQKGLVRFNGLDFRLYNTKDGLPANDIVISMLDNKGRLWLRPFGAKLCYYKDGKIHNNDNDSLVNEIHKMLLTNQTVFSLDVNGDITIYDFMFDSYGRRGALFLKGDSISKVWCYGEEAALGIYHNKGKFYSFQPEYVKVFNQTGLLDSFETSVRFIHQFRRKYNTAYSFIEKNYKSHLVKFSLAKGIPNFRKLISKLDYERANYFWFYQADKILYARKNKILITDTSLQSEKIFEEFPSHIYISGLFVDNYENLWVSTRNDGLYFLSAASLFSNRILSNRVVEKVKKVGTDIYYISGKDVYLTNATDRKEHRILTQNNVINNSLIGATNSRLVVPSLGGKLDEYHNSKGKLQFYQRVNHTVGAVKDLLCTDDFVAVCGSSGFNLIENDGDILDLYPKRAISLAHNQLTSELYLGTMNGVLKYDLKSKNRLLKTFSEVTGQVNSLDVGVDGLIWIQSNDEIFCYQHDKLIKRLDRFNYIKNYSINVLKASSGNKLYVGTSKGLVILDYAISGDSLININENIVHSGTGLVDNFVKDIEGYEPNKLLIATKSGLNLLDLRKLIKQQNIKIDIFELYVNGEHRNPLAAKALSHNEQFVRIGFSSLLYGRMSKYYKYRMVGLRNKWETISANELEFGPLAPGDYKFEVVAVDEKGQWLGSTTVLPISIKPAFWQTWWFLTLVFLILLGLLIWFIYRTVKRKQNSLTNERTFAELKMQALKSQMNPHFIFNSLNAIQSYVNQGDIKESNRYISKFSKLVRQTLNFASRDYITLQEEIEYLGNYVSLEKLRFGNKFFYILDIDERLDTNEIFVPPMLIQIYAENAVKHGLTHQPKTGKIEISFYEEGGYLVCIVDDNGVGRKFSAETKKVNRTLQESKGMNLNLDRLEMYNVILDNKILLEIVDKMDGEIALGTTVILKIPTI